MLNLGISYINMVRDFLDAVGYFWGSLWILISIGFGLWISPIIARIVMQIIDDKIVHKYFL